MHKDLKNYIKIEDCKDGYLYLISARNSHIGIFNKDKNSFTISRVKFSNNYLFDEFHWDTGEPYGTVKPIREIGIAKPATLSYLNTESEKYWEEYKDFISSNLNIDTSLWMK
jgi:hypothetical protein